MCARAVVSVVVVSPPPTKKKPRFGQSPKECVERSRCRTKHSRGLSGPQHGAKNSDAMGRRPFGRIHCCLLQCVSKRVAYRNAFVDQKMAPSRWSSLLH
mmetsp:Transcript_10390/g.21864  ORF Transcript_10390/g.21864 Transcript_10390/m.21864 type:complete len:99 (-) Transcript_10390:1002-1298(-)